MATVFSSPKALPKEANFYIYEDDASLSHIGGKRALEACVQGTVERLHFKLIPRGSTTVDAAQWVADWTLTDLEPSVREDALSKVLAGATRDEFDRLLRGVHDAVMITDGSLRKDTFAKLRTKLVPNLAAKTNSAVTVKVPLRNGSGFWPVEVEKLNRSVKLTFPGKISSGKPEISVYKVGHRDFRFADNIMKKLDEQRLITDLEWALTQVK
jgi:hypothetical protein